MPDLSWPVFAVLASVALTSAACGLLVGRVIWSGRLSSATQEQLQGSGVEERPGSLFDPARPSRPWMADQDTRSYGQR